MMENIIGHNSVKEFLSASYNDNKISHAYIFEGSVGVGRYTTAKAFAELIAEAPKKLSADDNPDIVTVTNEYFGIDKKNLSIEAIREMKNDVYLRPMISKRKVYIIPKADTMLAAAQNSLLKVFEEPPEYCTIILIAENANSLLMTIRSRAVKLRFNPLAFDAVKNFLVSKGFDEKRAETAAIMSAGSIGKALSFAEDDAELRENVLRHISALTGSHIALYDFVVFLRKNESSIGLILSIISDWSSDVLHLKLDGKYNVKNADKASELKKFCSAVTKEAAFRFCEIAEKYTLVINAKTNYQNAVLCMATEYWEEIHGRNYRSSF